MVGSWSPAAASMISGRNFASSGEVRPTSRNRPPTIGIRSVRHDSSSSLRTRTARPCIRPRPDEAKEHVLERRPCTLEGGQPDARRDDDRRAARREATSASVTDTIRPAAVRLHAIHPGQSAEAIGQRARPPRPGRAPGRAGRAAGRTAPAASSSGPSVTSRPWSRIPTRSQIRSTSARTWVEKMIVARSRRSAMSASRSRRPSGSSELTGSSRTSRLGSATSAWAIPSRWRIPPE